MSQHKKVESFAEFAQITGSLPDETIKQSREFIINLCNGKIDHNSPVAQGYKASGQTLDTNFINDMKNNPAGTLLMKVAQNLDENDWVDYVKTGDFSNVPAMKLTDQEMAAASGGAPSCFWGVVTTPAGIMVTSVWLKWEKRLPWEDS